MRFDTIEVKRCAIIVGLVVGGQWESEQGEKRDAYELGEDKDEMIELRQEVGQDTFIYRYIPLTLDYDQGSTKLKMIEIMYNEHNLQSLLKQYHKTYVLQISILFTVTIIVSIVISSIIARPI